MPTRSQGLKVENVILDNSVTPAERVSLFEEACISLVTTALIILAGLSAGHLICEVPLAPGEAGRVAAMGAAFCVVSITAIVMIARHSIKVATIVASVVLFVVAAMSGMIL